VNRNVSSLIATPQIRISTQQDILEIEKTRIEDVGLAANTYELIKTAAIIYQDRVALRFLPEATLEEQSITYTYTKLFAKVTQAANTFHQFGIDSEQVVSMLLPNLPESHFTIWGAEAAGIFNPLNTMLEVEHLASIMQEAKTKVLVCLGPDSDASMWRKVIAVKELVPTLSTVLTVDLPGVKQRGTHITDSVFDFIVCSAAYSITE